MRIIGASLQEIGIQFDVALQLPSEGGQKMQTRATDFFWWGHTEAFDSLPPFNDRIAATRSSPARAIPVPRSMH
jgi:hypothetical protein